MKASKRTARITTSTRPRGGKTLEQRITGLEKVVAAMIGAMSSSIDTDEAKPDEADLAVALDHYTNPLDPEYDAEFTAELRRIRPDWFDEN